MLPSRLLLKLSVAVLAALLAAAARPALAATQPHKVMLLTGQSNPYHDWAKSAPIIRDVLAQTGLFAVETVHHTAEGRRHVRLRAEVRRLRRRRDCL